jgi:hypothetical protein
VFKPSGHGSGLDASQGRFGDNRTVLPGNGRSPSSRVSIRAMSGWRSRSRLQLACVSSSAAAGSSWSSIEKIFNMASPSLFDAGMILLVLSNFN